MAIIDHSFCKGEAIIVRYFSNSEVITDHSVCNGDAIIVQSFCTGEDQNFTTLVTMGDW